jgi:tetratricopeptide (TPR) repeat protein
MYEYDITLPPVVHGPVLVSFADLNGFEFGSKVRNPYQALFERKPDDVIANGVAVFYGDMALPDAAALQYLHGAMEHLGKDPKGALELARKAVEICPRNYDANLALGDALHANGDDAGARRAYLVAQSRIAEMEPSVQEQERPEMAKKLARLSISEAHP